MTGRRRRGEDKEGKKRQEGQGGEREARRTRGRRGKKDKEGKERREGRGEEVEARRTSGGKRGEKDE